LSSSRASSTNRARQAYSCGASSEINAGMLDVGIYYARSMPACADITLVQGNLSRKLPDKDSIGPQ
jgi:hypothetical protein